MKLKIEELNKTETHTAPFGVTYYANLAFDDTVIGKARLHILNQEEDENIVKMNRDEFMKFIIENGTLELDTNHIQLKDILKRSKKNIQTVLTETITF